MASAEIPLELKNIVSIMMYELNGETRFHVHLIENGLMDDVTDQYEMRIVQVPEPDRPGWIILKKAHG